MQGHGIPQEIGQNAYHYAVPGVFLVMGRWTRQRNEVGRMVSIPVPDGSVVEGNGSMGEGLAYHITPEKSVGKEVVVLAKSLVEVALSARRLGLVSTVRHGR